MEDRQTGSVGKKANPFSFYLYCQMMECNILPTSHDVFCDVQTRHSQDICKFSGRGQPSTNANEAKFITVTDGVSERKITFNMIILFRTAATSVTNRKHWGLLERYYIFRNTLTIPLLWEGNKPSTHSSFLFLL